LTIQLSAGLAAEADHDQIARAVAQALAKIRTP